MNRVINSVKNWHEFQFPDATEFQIIKKIQEELCELSVELVEGSIERIAEEIADVCIVSIALGRFRDIEINIDFLPASVFEIKWSIASVLSETVRDKRLEGSIRDFFLASNDYLKSRQLDLWEEIEKKLAINKGRDWSSR